MRISWVGLAVALAAGAFAGEGRAAAPPDVTAQGCDVASLRAGFFRGDDRHRQEVLARLRAIAASPETPATSLPCDIQILRSRYTSRAGRQQTLLDGGSAVTGTAGIVAAFAEGAGATTQGYWAAGALLPVLLGSFNANEPTRDLFHGAGQGLDFMTLRWGEIRSASDRLLLIASGLTAVPTTAPQDWAAALAGSKTRCDSLGVAMAGIEQTGTEALKVDARKVLGACSDAAVMNNELHVYATELFVYRNMYNSLIAADALALEATVGQRDHDLRYTPLETFGVLAAAPFEAAGSLLSGTDSRAAVDALRTQAASRDLSIDLATLDLPPPPQVQSAISLTAAGMANPDVRAAADALNLVRPTQNRAAALANRISRLTLTNQVAMSYDATTRVVTVVGRPKPAAAQAKDGGPQVMPLPAG